MNELLLFVGFVLATVLLLLASIALALKVADGLAHIGRYRDYRRMYPAAERGRVWKYTK